MTAIGAVAAALLTAVSAMLVRECGGKLAALVSVTGGVVILLAVFPRVSSLVAELREITALGAEEWLPPILKIIAVGYAVEIGADICRDLGEAGAAARLELCGKLEIFLLALPSLLGLLELAVSLVR